MQMPARIANRPKRHNGAQLTAVPPHIQSAEYLSAATACDVRFLACRSSGYDACFTLRSVWDGLCRDRSALPVPGGVRVHEQGSGAETAAVSGAWCINRWLACSVTT
jgi:hypothetical protein